MNFTLKSILVAFITASAVMTAPTFAQSKKYDFEYNVSGQPSVKPIQVFDNGIQTFIQFAPEKNVPAIFAITDCGTKVLLDASQQGNYHVVQGRFKTLSLQLGQKSSTVIYAGANLGNLNEPIAKERCDETRQVTSAAITSTTAYTAVPPTLGDEAAIAKRQKMERAQAAKDNGERVFQDGAWRVRVEPLDPSTGMPLSSSEKAPEKAIISVAAAAKKTEASKPAKKVATRKAKSSSKSKVTAKASESAAPVTQQGSIADPSPESAKLNVVPVAQNQPGQQIIQQQPVQPVVMSWDIKAGDSIRQTMDRWRQQAGWEMVWSYDGDFTAQASANFQGDFQNAIRALMNAMPDSVDLTVNLAANKLLYVSKKK